MYYRRVYGVRQSISGHFSCYKVFYILLGVCALAGLILGLTSGFRYSGAVELEHLADNLLIKFIEKDISIISLFLSRFFIVVGLFALIWVANYKPWMCFVTPIIIIYRAFLLGLNCAVLIVLFKLGGVVNVLVVYIPCHFLTLFCLISWGSACMRQNIYTKHTLIGCYSTKFFSKMVTLLIICGAVVLFACTLEAILLPLLTASFFMGIS